MTLTKIPPLYPIPSLYPILDTVFLPANAEPRRAMLAELVASLAAAGVEILQYRNKQGGEDEILRDAEIMRAASPDLTLILNDYARLVMRTGFDGVHLGQEDLAPAEARALLGAKAIIGVSTHNQAQLRTADGEPVDYIAVGPVFATASKENPDPVVGIEGVRLARRLTTKPLVAIGGISAANAAEVWAAGADSVAVISGIFAAADPAKSAAEFLRRFHAQAELRAGL